MRKIETALILAAGFGTRARPLSYIKPKPLFPVLNKSLLEHWVEKLFLMGVKNIIINTHYLAKQIEDNIHNYLVKKYYTGLNFYIFNESEAPLGAGGTIKTLTHLYTDKKIGPDFFVICGDIYTNLNFENLVKEHYSNFNSLATLALFDYEKIANVSLGEIGQILAFRSEEKVLGEVFKRAFTGIMIVRAQILDMLPSGPSDIIHFFNQALKSGYKLHSSLSELETWSDIGTVHNYWQLNKKLANNNKIIAPTALIESQNINGFLIAGANSRVHKNVKIKDSIIWPNAEIQAGAEINNAVISGEVPQNTIINGGAWAGENNYF